MATITTVCVIIGILSSTVLAEYHLDTKTVTKKNVTTLPLTSIQVRSRRRVIVTTHSKPLKYRWTDRQSRDYSVLMVKVTTFLQVEPFFPPLFTLPTYRSVRRL